MNSAFALTLMTLRGYATPDYYFAQFVFPGGILKTSNDHLNIDYKTISRVTFSLLLLFVFVIPAFSASKKIIFDTDPGTDDAMALMLALNSPELDVRAITVVPGNVTAKQGLENALRMVSGQPLRHSGCGWGAASFVSKIDHRGDVARQEWAGQHRIASQQMQSRFALWTRSDYRNGARGTT